MRPLELSLVLVNLLTLCVLAVPRLHVVRWTGYVAFVAVLIAIVQMIVEGPRWQMIPAYVLTGLFFLVWLLQSTTLAGRPVNRLAAGFAMGLGTLALVISAALPIVSPVFRFPRPSGPYAIGTLTYHWVDAARPEVFTADPNDHRELMVQFGIPLKQTDRRRARPTFGMPARSRQAWRDWRSRTPSGYSLASPSRCLAFRSRTWNTSLPTPLHPRPWSRTNPAIRC